MAETGERYTQALQAISRAVRQEFVDDAAADAVRQAWRGAGAMRRLMVDEADLVLALLAVAPDATWSSLESQGTAAAWRPEAELWLRQAAGTPSRPSIVLGRGARLVLEGAYQRAVDAGRRTMTLPDLVWAAGAVRPWERPPEPASQPGFVRSSTTFSLGVATLAAGPPPGVPADVVVVRDPARNPVVWEVVVRETPRLLFRVPPATPAGTAFIVRDDVYPPDATDRLLQVVTAQE
jgi:hypothetical protein